jgi:putative aldouronate transport system permease protein
MATVKRIKKGQFSLVMVFNYLIMIVIGIVTLFPFYITVIHSISPPEDFIMKEIILWPSRFEASYYKLILTKGSDLVAAYKVTLFVTIIGTLLNLVITSMTSYVLAQKKLPFRSLITLFIVFTMFFNGGMIPSFLLYGS